MKTSRGRTLKKNEVAVLYLEAEGYTETESQSKYRRFNILGPDGTEWPESAFVGRGGAIRFGRIATQSTPMLEWTKAWVRYQAWELPRLPNTRQR